jgi:hypothetical protein
MNTSDNLTIQLTIGSKSYSLDISRKNEEIYRMAGNLINNTIHRYINNFSELEKEDYMAMSLIDIAVDLVKELSMDNKMDELIKKIDNTLETELNKDI